MEEERARRHAAALDIQVQTKIKRARADKARPSVMVPLADESFLERFTALFEEHVEGFTGLRGARRERSAKELSMEWRVRLKAKQAAAAPGGGGKGKDSKRGGKKAAAAAPDERKRLDAIKRYQQLKRTARAGGSSSSSKGIGGAGGLRQRAKKVQFT